MYLISWDSITLHAFQNVMKLNLRCLINKKQSSKCTMLIHSGNFLDTVSSQITQNRTDSSMEINPYTRFRRVDLKHSTDCFSPKKKNLRSKIHMLKTFFFSYLPSVRQVWLCWVQLPRSHLSRHGGSTYHTINHQSGELWDKGKVLISKEKPASLLRFQ